LAEAARKGRPAVVRRLLQEQADPNSLDPQAKACHTPLMAAAAAGSVGVVAMLLLAGADPGLRSPAGVAAADLTTNAAIGRVLSAFGKELEAELREAGPAPPGSAARSEAVGRVQRRAVPLIEKALQKPLRGRLARGPRADVTGADARKARKERREEREAARLQRVAEKAAARRGQEDEEARLQRVAEKAAKRRASRALRKERVRQWREAKGRGHDDDKHRSRRRRRSAERQGSRRSTKAAPKVSSECFMCPACSWCGERTACGVCGELGVCSGCSTCSICGRVSGFCAAPAVAAIPGYHGALGRPEMSGMNKPEEAFPQAAYIRSEKKRKRRSESRSRDRKGGSKADRGGGQARSGQPREPAEEDCSGSECSDGSYTYSYCSEDASAPGSPPPA